MLMYNAIGVELLQGKRSHAFIMYMHWWYDIA